MRGLTGAATFLSLVPGVIRKDHDAGFQVQFQVKQRRRFGCAAFSFRVPIGGNGGHNMMTIRLRGETYHADFTRGHEHLVRGTLGTRNRAAAVLLRDCLETAIVQGAQSAKWSELVQVLPPRTFSRFAEFAGLKQKPLVTWSELREQYEAKIDQKLRTGDLTEGSAKIYRRAFDHFDSFLTETKKSTLLEDITEDVAAEFKEYRIRQIKLLKRSRGAVSYAGGIGRKLRSIFSFAVQRGMIAKNPFPAETEPKAKQSAKPYTADELIRLEKHADEDFLLFRLFRWTGFRRGDAIDLTWDEVHFDAREIQRVTVKWGKEVCVPMSPDLFSALKKEHKLRSPQRTDHVLLDPQGGDPQEYWSLTRRLASLGERAHVRHVHAHRFRSTFAVDLLLRGIPLPSVARILGDTVETIVEHYVPYVDELKEHARLTLTSGKGIEQFASQCRHIGNYRRHNKGQLDAA